MIKRVPLLVLSLFFVSLYAVAQNTTIPDSVNITRIPDSIRYSGSVDSSRGMIMTPPYASTPVPISGTKAADSSQSLSLDQCIAYALNNQPALRQSLIGVNIARLTNQINLSGWLPQVNVAGNLSHYIQQPTTYVTNTANPTGPPILTKTGVVNTAIPELTATQAIFNPQLLYAAKAAPLYIRQAQQHTDSTQIDLVSNVSKAFYTLLQTLEQINVLKEDTARLNKNVSDTYHQYKGGLVDETDWDEAVITLNNSLAQLKQSNENVIPEYAALKQLMGFPPESQFNVAFDTAQMRNDVTFDTTQQLAFEKRIEFQQLQTQKLLQQRTTDYYRLAYLPTISAFYDYDYEFESNSASNLFSKAYPYSIIGLQLNIPIFTGFSRVKSVHRSKLQEGLLDWEEVGLKSEIYSEYTTAMANYKGNLYNLAALEHNEELAKRVYGIVALQYKQGIIPYLNVITAESNLITAEIGYINALFQLLSSKIDLEKSMGYITANKRTN